MPAEDILQAGRDLRPAQLRKAWGDAISKQRELVGMSRRELAALVGVTEQAVGSWERGETAPKPHMQIAIADALGVVWAVMFKPGQVA